MSTTTTPEYILGTDAAELWRLGFQHRLWSAAAHEAWAKARIAPGQSILDVGCGPGYAAFDLAHIAGPGGRVVGVDESAPFIAHLNAAAQARHVPTITAHVGDVQHIDEVLCRAAAAASQPSPIASFDLAYARWVLCFVKDPEAVVRAVARLLKPGGRFVVQDYFDYEHMTLAPKRPEFSKIIDAVARSWRARGGNPDLVGNLPGIMSRAGLTVTHLDSHNRLARPGSTIWNWPTTFWKSFVPRLVQMNEITQGDADDFFACWTEASNDPNAFMLLPPVFDVIAEKSPG
ncbi:MAG: methyltransferase domain-containing protein [Phycisphaeraceae bacterium]|nr:MAG: methyltransferase domain-containing protein [Phycisphaeraceae bacterium]